MRGQNYDSSKAQNGPVRSLSEIKSKSVVIIPCRNEEKTIRALIDDVLTYLPAVMVVDNGSSDSTAALAQSAGAMIIRDPDPAGKGQALRLGLEHACRQGYAYALTMDGDGQHRASDIPKFLALLAEGDVDLIIGDRFGQSAKMPWLRRQVNHCMTRLLSHLVCQSLPDSQCGFRCISLAAFQSLSLHTRFFEFESELLVRAAQGGWRIRSVPIEVVYRSEKSRIAPLQDTLRWLRWLLREIILLQDLTTNRGATHIDHVLPAGTFGGKSMKRICIAVMGGTVLLIGIAMILLPGPAILVVPAGLAILATEFVWARNCLGKVQNYANKIRPSRKPPMDKD